MTAPKAFLRRILFFGVLAAVAMAALALRLADQQLGDVEANRQRADENARLVSESARKDRLK